MSDDQAPPGPLPAPPAAAPIQGSVDHLDGDTLIGWAAQAGVGVSVRIAVRRGGMEIGSGSADLPRPDIGQAIGFTVTVDPAPSAWDLLSGAISIEATGTGGERAPLPLHSGLVGRLTRAALHHRLVALEPDDFAQLIREVGDARGSPKPFDHLLDGAPHGELSGFELPVGHVSPDGFAVIGRRGHIFLIGGSNALLDQYRRDQPEATTAAEARRWCARFAERRDRLAERGILYRQLIVPEKSSVLAELMPVAIAPPTALFARLEHAIARSPVAADYLPLFDGFRAAPDREGLYRTTDTHLSAAGAFRVLAAILGSIGAAVPEMALPRRQIGLGDLGARFPGAHLCWVDRRPSRAAMAAQESALERIAFVEVPGHNGSRAVFRNPGAPIRRRVVAFANSFFERGGSPQGVSWWLARWFAEYHFVWSPEFDFGYVDEVKPDMVIGQTIERFLTRVPDA